MDFPTYPLREIPVSDAMEEAFGIRPVKVILGLDLVCVFESESQVRSLHPNQSKLLTLDGRIQNATASGSETDCVPVVSVPNSPLRKTLYVALHIPK